MRVGWIGAMAIGLVAAAHGQTTAPAAANPSPTVKPAPTHRAHHRSARHAPRRHVAAAATGVAPLAGGAPTEPGAPAPVPNENVDPPRDGSAPSTKVTPSLMSIHYPPVGEGYVQGSSPNAMDDRNTAKAPGLEMTVPIQPAPPGGH